MKRSRDIHALRKALDGITITEPLNDPVRYVQRLRRRTDAEIGGFLVSTIAYGRVEHIMRSARGLLDTVGEAPARFVADFSRSKMREFKEFEHRFTRSTHIACLIIRLKYALRDHGSLHAMFRQAWTRSPDMRTAMSDFADNLRRYDCPGFCDDCATPRRQSVRWLLSKPGASSAAKRMCLYLRWMVRDTYPDIGAWEDIPKSALVMPLDTHVARIGRLLGLTERDSSNWMTAVEITRELKRLDPDDPLRYDYALSHLGIDGDCYGKLSRPKCTVCKVRAFCREVA